ncbi:hypothetical protein RclHR1_32580001 [Rhizophagus clarus]|uniref:Uncharacterized protein n=1 Tax=Rhizophagus clarus TaxID=94130 RepID=A0A2Z6R906_9GLOM|nr:hypothetical protein RclHR1_32580001 [Rhizophagus clarus]
MTDKGQYKIHGDCAIFLDAKKKRKKTAINKKDKKLDLKILDANENIQAYIKRLQSDQEIEIPAPTQDDSSVSKYFKSIKLYAITQNKDLDDFNIKIDFIIGLSLDNKRCVYLYAIGRHSHLWVDTPRLSKSFESVSESGYS